MLYCKRIVIGVMHSGQYSHAWTGLISVLALLLNYCAFVNIALRQTHWDTTGYWSEWKLNVFPWGLLGAGREYRSCFQKEEDIDVELVPLQVTQFPASHSSCKASGTEPDTGTAAASVLMKTKPVCRSTRASWMALSRPDPRLGFEAVGTRSTVRLCSMHSNTASATAARRGRMVPIERYSTLLVNSWNTHLFPVKRRDHPGRGCSQTSPPKHSLSTVCQVH